MTYNKKDRHQYRLYLRTDTITQIKLLALILGRADEWNEVADDMMRMGVAYANEAGHLELQDWKGSLTLWDLSKDLKLSTIKGELPKLDDN